MKPELAIALIGIILTTIGIIIGASYKKQKKEVIVLKPMTLTTTKNNKKYNIVATVLIALGIAIGLG
ncbi:hypothetical protein KY317_03170, partial [Candidatus Woesearchaeota archaeon]|nr:hypothetical protein [Candidatus Woesearchaeota archaeon]